MGRERVDLMGLLLREKRDGEEEMKGKGGGRGERRGCFCNHFNS